MKIRDEAAGGLGNLPCQRAGKNGALGEMTSGCATWGAMFGLPRLVAGGRIPPGYLIDDALPGRDAADRRPRSQISA
jgi:hypothetical protein